MIEPLLGLVFWILCVMVFMAGVLAAMLVVHIADHFARRKQNEFAEMANARLASMSGSLEEQHQEHQETAQQHLDHQLMILQSMGIRNIELVDGQVIDLAAKKAELDQGHGDEGA